MLTFGIAFPVSARSPMSCRIIRPERHAPLTRQSMCLSFSSGCSGSSSLTSPYRNSRRAFPLIPIKYYISKL